MNNKKTMLKLYKIALNKIAKIKLTDLHVDISAKHYTDRLCFIITVFDKDNDNVSFYFYNTDSVKDIKSRLKIMVAAIKTNDFEVVESVEECNKPF